MNGKAEALESAQAYLKRCNGAGRSLHDHLTDVLLTIAKERPENPLESFESISVRVKETFVAAANHRDHVVSAENSISLFAASDRQVLPSLDENTRTAVLSKAAAIVALVKPEPQPDDEAEESDWDPTSFPNVFQQSKTLEWAGVALDEQELYQVTLSLQKLAAKESLFAVRLFGKIFGTQKDYIIAEAKRPSHPESEEDPASKDEPAGVGLNEWTYFVCSEPGSGNWTALPDVKVQMIKKSCYMRRFFTGNLNSSVPGYPHFPWSEAHYLRAQIARIVSATTVVPKGLYSLNTEEETPVVAEDEEFKGVSATELLQAENWVHSRPFLNKQGRLTKWQAPEKEEEEESEAAEPKPKTPEQLEDEVDAAEEEVEQLRSLSEDEANCWAFRLAPSTHTAPPPHSVTVARSLKWPGAVSAVVANSKQAVSFYVGYGQKYLGARKTYTPPQIPQIQSEFVLQQKSDDEEEQTIDLLQEQTDPLPPPPKSAEEIAAEQANNEEQQQEEEEEDS